MVRDLFTWVHKEKGLKKKVFKRKVILGLDFTHIGTQRERFQKKVVLKEECSGQGSIYMGTQRERFQIKWS